MAVDLIARAMAGGAGGGSSSIETFSIMRTEWNKVDDQLIDVYAPYKYNVIVPAQTKIDENTLITLINDNPALFSNCRFAIKSEADGNIEFVAVEDPGHGVSLRVMFTSIQTV